MSDSVEEAAELVEASDVLNINIGTPNEKSIVAMFEANKTAHKLGRPVALDPVAVGATRLRRKLIEDLLSSGTPTIVRGNLAEIFRACRPGMGRQRCRLEPRSRASWRNRSCGCPEDRFRRCRYRKIDYASDGKQIISIANGHPFMTRVTGMGCVATSIIAAFLPRYNPSLWLPRFTRWLSPT